MKDPNFPTIEEWTEYEIIRRMEHFDKDKRRVAHSLGVCLKTLHNRIHENNLEGEYITGKWSEDSKIAYKNKLFEKKMKACDQLNAEVKNQRIIKDLRGY